MSGSFLIEKLLRIFREVGVACLDLRLWLETDQVTSIGNKFIAFGWSGILVFVRGMPVSLIGGPEIGLCGPSSVNNIAKQFGKVGASAGSIGVFLVVFKMKVVFPMGGNKAAEESMPSNLFLVSEDGNNFGSFDCIIGHRLLGEPSLNCSQESLSKSAWNIGNHTSVKAS